MNQRLRGLIAAVAIIATACGTTASPSAAPSTGAAASVPPAATPAASSPATATKLNVWARNYTLNQDEPWQPAKKKFEAAHAGVTVELSGAPYDPQYQRIQLSQAGSVSDMPDIMQMDNIWLGEFTEGGIAANLDSYYANWADAADILPTFKDSTKWNGSQHAVWFYSDIRLMIWNKNVFKKAGLDPDKGPATWSELFADAQAIKGKVPGVVPVGFPAASQEGTVDRWYSYLFMTGSNILSPDNKKAVFNDAGGQKALQLLVDLVNKGYTSKDVLNQDADAISNGTFAGKYGIMLATVGDGLSDRPEGMDAATYKSTIGAALPPICDGCQQATTAGGWMLGIGDKSPNKDLAWEFITDVTNGKTIVPFEAQYTRVPVRQSGLADPTAFKDDPYFDQEAKAATVAHFPPFVAKYTSMIEILWTGIQKAVNGDASVKDALDGAANDVNTLLSS
jgi:ABC-type glycerol-3-phosphate transport system substrate-binding protein